MNNIKVSILGADGYVYQIPRIKEGMEALGHVLSEESPDLIYSNDPSGYNKALLLKKKYPKAYLILNFLDIPWHMPNIQKQTELLVKNYFLKADIITAISFKVKKDIGKFYDKKVHVIYNPIKDVYFDENVKKNNIFLYVGRTSDPVKRFSLVRESLLKIKDGEKNIKICGSQNPNFGNYLGVIKDQELNKLYNSSKYVLLPSASEGIGLPMIEGMICGAIPITCSDNLSAKEFSPADFICKPDAQSIVNKLAELNKEYEAKRELALKFGKKYKIQFDKKNIAKNIINCYSKKVQLLGPSGSGQLAKMVNQICIAGLVQGLSEAINFGLNAGLKMEDVIDVISKGAAQSWQMENRYKTMIDGKFEFGFAVDWMRKDLKIALDEAKKNNSPLPITKIVDGYYEEVQKMGGNRWDTSSLIRRLKKK